MIKISKREQLLLFHILNNDIITCKDLAKLCHLSEKTIRNSISQLNLLVQNNLILSNNRGYYINNTLTHLIDSLTTEAEDDRANQQLLHHIINFSPCYFDELCDLFFLSPSALQNRVKQLNQELAYYHLFIRRKKNQLLLEGTIDAKRKLLVQLIKKEAFFTFDNIDALQNYFPLLNIKKIKLAVDNSLESFNYSIPNNYKENLYIQIFSIIDSYSESDLQPSIAVKDPTLMNLSRSITSLLNIENDYIAEHIYISLSGIARNTLNPTPYSSEFSNKIKAIILDVFSDYSIHVDCSGFISFLSTHIYHLIQRHKNNNHITSSFLNIKNDSFYIYDIAVSICKEISQEFKISISDPDISLIAIHIGFSIEKYFQEITPLSDHFIYIYSKNKSLEQKIIQYIQSYSHQLSYSTIYESSDILTISSHHLLVTTESLPPFINVPTCNLSPFFNHQDQSNLTKSLLSFSEKQHNLFFHKLAQSHFDPSLFFIQSSYSTKESCLNFLNQQLLKKAIVNSDFLPSVIKRESLSSTAFMNNFAIPHALESLANQSKIVVLINPSGIQWDTQRITIVFLIAIQKEDRKNLKILYDHLTKSLCDPKKQAVFETVQSLDELLNLLI